MDRAGSWPWVAVLAASFFANTVGVPKLLRHEEPVGCDAQAGMVVEAAPASALVVSKPEVLLEVFVVAFDAPAHLGLQHHALQRYVLAQGGQPVLHGFLVAFGPLDERPLLGALLCAHVVAMRGAHTDSGESGAQREVRAFAPFEGLPL